VWPQDDDSSPECRDLVERLLVLDPKSRLGHRCSAAPLWVPACWLLERPPGFAYDWWCTSCLFVTLRRLVARLSLEKGSSLADGWAARCLLPPAGVLAR
jgi:hypothetical protein